MQALYDKVVALREVVMLEGVEREKIKLSDLYRQTEEQIATLQRQLTEMTAVVPDSSLELEDAKAALQEAMLESNLDAYGDAKISYREKNRVNVPRVLEVIGGDIGTFLEMTRVTQKTLSEYAKLMPDLKKDLMACVELESRDVVGITISDPK